MYNRRAGIGALYESGQRFSLAGWSPAEWSQFFSGVEQPLAQLYGTVAKTPVAALPAPTTSTPFGAVPQWLIPVGVIGAIWIASRSRRNPPRRHRARRRRR